MAITLAANLAFLFTERPFLERFEAAAQAGFRAVEILSPYDTPVAGIAERLAGSGLALALINAPFGDAAAGERGLAALPGREAEFREGFEKALDYAEALNCERIHCMAGIPPEGSDPEAVLRTYVDNLADAALTAASTGRTVTIEPINARDMPGYFLGDTATARRVIEAVGAHNLKLQLDLYHCQVTEGDLAAHIRDCADITGHVQIAGAPDRAEPDVGEIHYPYLFEVLAGTGYAGYVGCEYRPRGRTEDGLGWRQAVEANAG